MNDNISIIRDLKSELHARFGENIKEVILFGSQLYRKPGNDSDYDILIILKNKPDWKYEREISNICYMIDLKYGIVTDNHLICESELNSLRGKQPIFVNAIKDGIHV